MSLVTQYVWYVMLDNCSRLIQRHTACTCPIVHNKKKESIWNLKGLPSCFADINSKGKAERKLKSLTLKWQIKGNYQYFGNKHTLLFCTVNETCFYTWHLHFDCFVVLVKLFTAMTVIHFVTLFPVTLNRHQPLVLTSGYHRFVLYSTLGHCGRR